MLATLDMQLRGDSGAEEVAALPGRSRKASRFPERSPGPERAEAPLPEETQLGTTCNMVANMTAVDGA
jgi:hypothetical protein